MQNAKPSAYSKLQITNLTIAHIFDLGVSSTSLHFVGFTMILTHNEYWTYIYKQYIPFAFELLLYFDNGYKWDSAMSIQSISMMSSQILP